MNSNVLSDLSKQLVLTLFGILLSLVVLEFFLRLCPVHEGAYRLAVNDNNPIIRHKENRDFIFSNGWNFPIVTTKHSNNYGFINDHDYSNQEDTSLMAIIGDSFVEALQVENRLTMHGILAKETADGEGRVYSFGASGSPLSTYLAYAEYVSNEFRPTSMVFVIIINDFDESISKYREQPGMHLFRLTSNGELELERSDFEPSIVRKLAKQSALIRYLHLNLQVLDRILPWILGGLDDSVKYAGNILVDASSEHVLDSKKAVDKFFDLLPLYSHLNAESILFVIDGMRPDLYSDTEFKTARGSYFDIMRKDFINEAMKNGYEIIDMQPIFIARHRENGAKFEFETDGHWNAAGHKLVAESIQYSNVYSRTFGSQQRKKYKR